MLSSEKVRWYSRCSVHVTNIVLQQITMSPVSPTGSCDRSQPFCALIAHHIYSMQLCCHTSNTYRISCLYSMQSHSFSISCKINCLYNVHLHDFASDTCCRNRTALDGALQEWLQNCAPAFDALLAQLVRRHQQRSELFP